MMGHWQVAERNKTEDRDMTAEQGGEKKNVYLDIVVTLNRQLG